MTDKELLELAAKAAGLDDARYCTFAGMEERCGFGGAIYSDKHAAGMGSGYWNPLEDDGDALRLMVRLGIRIDPDFGIQETIWKTDCWKRGAEPHGSDPYAATRRAIVRAAAEIGKASSNAEVKGGCANQ